ncbi:MAG: ATP-binding protein [Acidobacteriota bacterium]|nr:ATP-binding protein [Acidobacteriota bacterium]
MIRVVVTGSECTGKTTLARALAEVYRCVHVPEFVREFVVRKGTPPEPADVGVIARGQLALEDSLVSSARNVVVLDTDLVSTFVYSQHYFGSCPDWIDEMVNVKRADLYVVAGIDVPWTADGAQRDRGHMRGAMHELFRSELLRRGFPFIEVEGSKRERLVASMAAIEPLLAAR